MPRETMTGRERWLAVLRRQTPDRVPMDYWATAEATARLCSHLGCDREEMLRRLHIDTPLSVGGRYVGPALAGDTDVWGLKRRTVDYGSGAYQEVVNAPLAAFGSPDEIDDKYSWPNPDWWDYGHIPAELAGRDDRIVRGGGSEPFLRYKDLRGDVQAYMDMALNPGTVRYILGKLFDLAYEDTRRIFEAAPGRVEITYVAEDLGSQEGLLFSPAHFREYLLPGMKRMAALTRENGSCVFTHSDGSFREVIQDLIGIGVQVLNPIQWRCRGMDREGLKRDFGDALVFHGGIDNQRTLPFGSVEDVRREVLDNYRILGAGGGYILAPCHNIQAVSPPENVVAMYETGYERGWR